MLINQKKIDQGDWLSDLSAMKHQHRENKIRKDIAENIRERTNEKKQPVWVFFFVLYHFQKEPRNRSIEISHLRISTGPSVQILIQWKTKWDVKQMSPWRIRRACKNPPDSAGLFFISNTAEMGKGDVFLCNWVNSDVAINKHLESKQDFGVNNLISLKNRT